MLCFAPGVCALESSSYEIITVINWAKLEHNIIIIIFVLKFRKYTVIRINFVRKNFVLEIFV